MSATARSPPHESEGEIVHCGLTLPAGWECDSVCRMAPRSGRSTAPRAFHNVKAAPCALHRLLPPLQSPQRVTIPWAVVAATFANFLAAVLLRIAAMPPHRSVERDSSSPRRLDELPSAQPGPKSPFSRRTPRAVVELARFRRSRGDDESRPNGRCSRQGPVSRRVERGRTAVRRSNKPCRDRRRPQICRRRRFSSVYRSARQRLDIRS